MDLFEGKHVKPMLIGVSAQAFDSSDYIYELKLDGERCVAFLDPLTGADLRNRRNVPMLSKVPELADIHKQVNARCILDGELIITVNGEPNFYEIQRRSLMSDKFKIYLHSNKYPATFVAFDILYHVDHEVMSWTMMQRKDLLEQVVTENERLMVSRYIHEHGVDLFNLAAGRNLEGIVAKRMESLYYQDKRSRDWIKCKALLDNDFVVCGFVEIPGGSASILLGQYDQGELVYKGHVTLGASRDAWEQIKSLRRLESPPFLAYPKSNEKVEWVEPTLVCSVKYLESTVKGELRHPVFKGLLMDKPAEECMV